MTLALQSKQVLPLLAQRGVPTGRETLAAVSDALGLFTRTEQGNAAARRWTRDQVDLIGLALRLRRGWGHDVTELRRVLAEPDAVEGLVAAYRSALEQFVTLAAEVEEAQAETEREILEVERPDIAALARRGAA